MPYRRETRPLKLFKGLKARSATPDWIGKKLHSDLSTEECIAHLRAGLAAYGLPSRDDDMFEAQWTGTARRHPARVVGFWYRRPSPGVEGQAMYFAIWPNGGFDEGTYQEMALVPPDRNGELPTPYIGHWAQRDNSLKTIGTATSATFSAAYPDH